MWPHDDLPDPQEPPPELARAYKLWMAGVGIAMVIVGVIFRLWKGGW